METITLTAKPRNRVGTRAAKKIRVEGLVPAVLYGHGMKPLSLQVVSRDLFNVLHTKAGENVLIDLNVQGVKLKESTCRIKDIQHNPRTEAITHVDFTVISLTEKIAVKVPLIVPHQEEIEGVKQGGVLDIVHHEIDIECLPAAIPEKIEVNLKTMKIGDTLHAKDLKLPAGVRCLFEAEEVVVALHIPKKEEEKAPEEAVQQPEVIEKGKKVEVEEGAAAEPKKEEPKKQPVEAKKPEAKKA